MPEFILDTSGEVRERQGHTHFVKVTKWTDLDAFTQGYIEALFFTEVDRLNAQVDHFHGFADLAPETLASIIADCDKFQREQSASIAGALAQEVPEHVNRDLDEASAGRDFWYTRNGHGVGFWDGDWLEPYASQLDAAAKAFSNIDAYLGDDGKVYLS